MLFGFGFGVKTGVSAPHSGATRLGVEEPFVEGLLSTDVVVLEIGSMEVRLKCGEPFSELDQRGVDAKGVRT